MTPPTKTEKIFILALRLRVASRVETRSTIVFHFWLVVMKSSVECEIHSIVRENIKSGNTFLMISTMYNSLMISTIVLHIYLLLVVLTLLDVLDIIFYDNNSDVR